MKEHGAYQDLLFDVRLSIRYHEHRQAFFQGMLNLSLFFSLVLGSGVCAVLLYGASPIWASVAALPATVLSAACLAFGMRDKASRHDDLRRRFIELERRLRGMDPTAGTASWGEQERLSIEADEMPVLRVVASMCHNEESRAMDFDTKELIEIGFWQKRFAPFFDVRADSLHLPKKDGHQDKNNDRSA